MIKKADCLVIVMAHSAQLWKEQASNYLAGQLTHVLRHTFASHFMMNGGNILVLQRVLGHTDIKMTMRYAHFAPDHLEDAVKLNPLNTFS